jgi:multicomponent K+:H+ antiporter subunit G
MNATLPLWAEMLIAVLLIASGLCSLIAALGVLWLPTFIQRMHPPALASSFGTWCIALASIVSLSLQNMQLELHAWLIIILLSITAPVTTVLLARAALFRERTGVQPVVPPPELR